MSSWGWQPKRNHGIWQCGSRWMRPLVAAAPWITVLLLLEMMHLLGGTLVSANGVMFELPDSGLGEGTTSDLVSIVKPMPNGTMLFFDDSRYLLGEHLSMTAFGEHLSERIRRSSGKTLLVIADRHVESGELLKLAALAKRSGVLKVLFAEKQVKDSE